MTMKAQLTVEEHGELTEDFQKEYVEKDGMFLLDVESAGGYVLEVTEGLKTALGQERKNLSAANAKLAVFGDLDPTLARDALEKVEEMKDWTPEETVQAQMKARDAQLLEKHRESLSGKDKEIQSLMTELERTLIDSAATEAIASHKGSIKLLLPHVRDLTRIIKNEAGRFVARIRGTDGEFRIGDSDGNYMTVPQLVQEMRSDDNFGRAFEGSGSSGSGAGDGGAGGGGDNNSAGSGGGTGGGSGGKVIKIPADDQESINAHMEEIASGEAVVVPAT